MKFIRAGVIQFDLFPRNCELTSAFENSASLLGKSTLCHTVLTRRKKIVFFHSTGKTLLLFFFPFDRTVCSCAKQSGVIGKIVDSYFCQSCNVIPFLSHRFLILCRIPLNPIKSLGFFFLKVPKTEWKYSNSYRVFISKTVLLIFPHLTLEYKHLEM